ncbi:hypothetical protein B5D80_19720 [Micromonospora wenchangensis]|uniref:Uncharacterized protein n=1 Tax=Micromonospora wenchangensis TaxID=1185415 RepID=A0A246RJ17_9ACTN|nr:hypothetical protein [Micromonospora wenchangensis]OWV04722.1 hypothetical protein B5D80_19720 [Micromonospora wenchangensis]
MPTLERLLVLVARNVAQAALGILNPLAGRLIFDDISRLLKKPSDSGLEERLKELGASMQQSSQLIAEIEGGLKIREAAVEKLKQEAQTARNIKDMTDQQRAAVAAVLRTEVAREGRKTLWQGAAVNAFFFVAGVLVTLWIS